MTDTKSMDGANDRAERAEAENVRLRQRVGELEEALRGYMARVGAGSARKEASR